MSSRHKKSKGKSRESTRLPSLWSEWVWSDDFQRFSRYRLDIHGEYEIDYRYADGGPTTAVASTFGSEPLPQPGPSTYSDDPGQNYTVQSAPQQDSSAGFSTSQDNTYTSNNNSSNINPGATGDIVTGLGGLAIDIPSYVQQAGQLDSRFVVRDLPSRWFQIGKVFKVLWTEPASDTATDLDRGTSHTVAFGQLAFSKIRRFVVIRKRLHCCLCLPILTYGGQGAAKAGVRAEDHAIVYPADKACPPNAPGEMLSKRPLGVVIDEPGETLDRMSRIDFGKVYTVQHNLKVMNVGRISKNDLKYLTRYYNESMGIGAEDDSF